ncbi:MAG: hypothetical protein HKN34_09920 [Gammaproteobacteria bacterium]|nr:hypothetical protein [Gammaproteobacteria bacterium]
MADKTRTSPAKDDFNWSELVYDLGLQGLAQEIAVNSVLEFLPPDKFRLSLSPELKELASSNIAMDIQQAINSKLNVSYRLEFNARQSIEKENPFQARKRQQELDRQMAIGVIKESEVVRKFNQAFGAELIEDSVKKLDE